MCCFFIAMGQHILIHFKNSFYFTCQNQRSVKEQRNERIANDNDVPFRFVKCNLFGVRRYMRVFFKTYYTFILSSFHQLRKDDQRHQNISPKMVLLNVTAMGCRPKCSIENVSVLNCP